MLILSLRTDKPEAEIGLWQEDKLLVEEKWQAHRHLAETLHGKIKSLLDGQSKAWNDIEGIICYQGPGSFTGLRIGLSAANALAASLPAAIITETGDDWLGQGLRKLLDGRDQKIALPEYGAPVHITQQRK